MNALLDFDRRYGMATSLVGSVSGGFSWILAHAQEVTTIFGLVGVICSAVLSFLAVALKLYRLGCRVREQIRRRRRNRRARLEHGYDIPFDAGMQDDDPEDRLP